MTEEKISKTTDDGIKRAAELLLKGATMLSNVCPTCKTPLYKYENKIICPTCNRQYVLTDKKGKEDRSMEQEIKKQPRKEMDVRYGKTIKVLEEKITELTEKIEKEEEPKKIAEIADAIKKVGEAINAIK